MFYNKLTIISAFLLGGITMSAQQAEDVLMTIGGTPVTVEEFTYIYEKNNGEQADYSKSSLNEYLDLYKKFKLKVAKARSMKMDTIPELKSELETYRRQLANSYLMDKEVKERLIKEAFERRQQDVRLAHLLIRPKKTGPDAGWSNALQRILKIKVDIENGKKTWDQAVRANSSDSNTAQTGGDLGFVTAMLPDGFYALENAAYDEKLGQVVGPVKTSLGYHLVKVLDRRPARGEVEAAHILIRKVVKKQPVEGAEARAMEAYNQLRLDRPWDEVVKEYSDDQGTKNKKGNIGKVGIGMYAGELEDAIFSLQNDGDYSMPIETEAGFHILKRIYKSDLSDYEAFRQRMDSEIEREGRYKESRQALIDDIKKKNNFERVGTGLQDFANTVESDFYTFKWRKDDVPTVDLFKMGDKMYSLKEFVDYLKQNVRTRQRFSKKKPPSEAIEEMFNTYTDEQAILYEEKNLEAAYPDFRNLMREYREGILLFEASKVNVWDKASADTVGLKDYYNQNFKRYLHAPRAKVINYVVKSTDEKTLKKIYKHAKKNDPENTKKKFNKKDEFFVKTFEDEVSKEGNDLKGLDWKQGGMSDFKINGNEGKTTFSKVVHILPSRQKTLKEARGYVIADYQDHLEKAWVAELMEEFPVTIDKKVLKKLQK